MKIANLTVLYHDAIMMHLKKLKNHDEALTIQTRKDVDWFSHFNANIFMRKGIHRYLVLSKTDVVQVTELFE